MSQPSEHEVLYTGQPKTIYESACTCGWKATRATPYEASEAWYTHKIEKHNEAQAAAQTP